MQVVFEDVLKHGLTAIWLIVELLISRIPIVSVWIYWASLYAMAYATFLWIYWAAAHEWVYTVLDWREPKSLGFYFAISALVIVTYFIMCALAVLRLHVFAPVLC